MKQTKYIKIHVRFTCGFSQVAAALQKGSGHFQLARQTTRIDDLPPGSSTLPLSVIKGMFHPRRHWRQGSI